MKRCPNCHSLNQAGALVCRECAVIMRFTPYSEPALRAREYTRLAVRDIGFLVLGNGAKAKIELQDISARGLCAVTSLHVEVAETVQLILLYPLFQDFVEKQAIVVWKKQEPGNLWRIGCDFGLIGRIDMSNNSLMSNIGGCCV